MYFKYLPCIKDIFLDSENRLVKKQWNWMKVPAVTGYTCCRFNLQVSEWYTSVSDGAIKK